MCVGQKLSCDFDVRLRETAKVTTLGLVLIFYFVVSLGGNLMFLARSSVHLLIRLVKYVCGRVFIINGELWWSVASAVRPSGEVNAPLFLLVGNLMSSEKRNDDGIIPVERIAG